LIAKIRATVPRRFTVPTFRSDANADRRRVPPYFNAPPPNANRFDRLPSPVFKKKAENAVKTYVSRFSNATVQADRAFANFPVFPFLRLFPPSPLLLF